MTALADQNLQACNKNSSPISDEDMGNYLKNLSGWDLIVDENIKQISKVYNFNDFLSAHSFSGDITSLAEAENHHPRICIEWGKVRVSWWTHVVSGLFVNDFIMAARCDQAYKKLSSE